MTFLFQNTMIRLLFLIFLQTPSYRANDSRYECGAHGRFEYCVDDIPGCIIGCHCHPGYYFDTDTKICEPNIKLLQNRRNYVSEPSRIQTFTKKNEEIAIITSTTSNAVDAKIDEITKDADDLSDWLYQKFFKTVENQVLNKTNRQEQLTRRSANPKYMNQLRKSRKLWKSSRRKKKKKSRESNLKNKLLRITEDDSLFDSSSSETSDSSDFSSSYKSSGSVSELETKANKGHKKLVILSKKPKPQLPSFIFLPSIDTPFYPPMGLPPPPAVPLYPIIPVPPIGTFTIVTTSKTEQDAISTTNMITTAVPGVATSSEITISSSTTTTVTSETVATETDSATEIPKNSLRVKGRSNNTTNKMKHQTRNKLLQKLRQKMKPSVQSLPAINFIDDQEYDSNFINVGIPKEKSPLPHISSNSVDEDIPKDEVDFKYLTQLIHRPNEKMINLPPSHNMRINSLNPDSYLPTKSSRITNRRQFNTYNKPEDIFYANLGRQIASMMRKIDSEDEQQINIEVGKDKSKPLPLFPKNIYSPRSFWERSVRSPIKNYLKEIEHFKKSNENLFSLENRVENEASKNFLSLRELENIISTVETAKSKLNKSNQKDIPTTNINFNLLHHNEYYDTTKNTIQLSKEISMENSKHKKLSQRRFLNDNYLLLKQFGPHTFAASNNYNVTNKVTTNSDRNQNDFKESRRLNSVQHTIPISDFQKSNTSILSQSNGSVSWDPTSKPKTLLPKRMPMVKYHWNSIAEHLNFHYYFDDNNQYEKSLYPIELPNVRRSYKYVGKPTIPSYFHHELHHFDYFE